jgi:acetolactate synthase-1/2/3 large subunit
MRLADYVFEYLSQHVKHAFMLVGGGSMFLNDAIGKSRITYTCALHEQGAGYMALGYAQVKNQLGLCVVTTGPGATNAITPCLSAWTDSIPVLFISGQVQTKHLTGESGLRYKGSQEVDILSMVEHITKYSVTVKDPSKIKIYLGAAIHAAMTGRKGPVWLDIPLDIQSAEIEPDKLESFSVIQNEFVEWQREENIAVGVDIVKRSFETCSKPVIFAGHGIISSNAEKQFFDLIDGLKCPILTTWKSIGLLSDNHPLYAGRPGAIGQTAANKIQQTCDLLLVLGAQMNLDQVAYNLDGVAPDAIKIVVDIDKAELNKFNDSWVKIHADIKEFLCALKIGGDYGQWVRECKEMQLLNKFYV